MHYLISGLAKSGTTRLFSQLQDALVADSRPPHTAFEPDTDEALRAVLARPEDTLTKVLIGRVKADNQSIAEFDRHLLIYRDPRDQFLSTLLYFFYDFQIQKNTVGYAQAYAALERKVADPEGVATIDLYREIAELAGRAPLVVFERLHDVQNAYAEAFNPYPVRYEALLEGENQGALEDYLGLVLRNDDVTVPDTYARVARSKGHGEWRRWFNRTDLSFANEKWGAHLEALGYVCESEPDALAISTESSLAYVRQFDPGGRNA